MQDIARPKTHSVKGGYVQERFPCGCTVRSGVPSSECPSYQDVMSAIPYAISPVAPSIPRT